MNITELINRLEEIKQLHGDMSIFLFQSVRVTPLEQANVVLTTGGNSQKYPNGIYIWIA